MSHIWLGIFVVFNFTYLEIVDINTIYCIRLQIKNMHVKKAPVLWGEKRVGGGGGVVWESGVRLSVRFDPGPA